ncbi:FAD synthase-like [Chrysoperla carnea]|uniref:FAD synthase-like n=1 Tax=Chrysoperla carnea TaxID=189513 RepID=UPI001D07EC62|nr:FAD synthase-like [Chrysoperla carnea]
MGFHSIKLFKFQFPKFKTNFIRNYCQNVKDTHRTAGIIVTGNEIIKGQVLDTNTQFLCKGLYDCGIKVARISVLPDDVDLISKEVKLFSDSFTYVLTSGGIGTTHDDVTYEAVAKAFNEPLHLHPEILTLVRNFYTTPESISAGQKLAMVPISAKLTFGFDKITGKRSNFPNVSVHNVYIFPGIPLFCRYLFTLVSSLQFGESKTKFYSKSVYLKSTEVDIVNSLNKLVRQNPNVDFGSYPEVEHRYYKVKISMDSQNKEDLEKAFQEVQTELKDHFTSYDDKPLDDTNNKIIRAIAGLQTSNIKSTYERINEVNLTNVIVWLNGTIETMIHLHLCHGAMSKDITKRKHKLEAIYIENNTQERNQKEFIDYLIQRYELKVHKFENINKEKLKNLLQNKCLLISLNEKHKHNKILENCNTEDPTEKWSNDDKYKFVQSLYLPYID